MSPVHHPVHASDPGIGVLDVAMGARPAPEVHGRRQLTQQRVAPLFLVLTFRLPLRDHSRFRNGRLLPMAAKPDHSWRFCSPPTSWQTLVLRRSTRP